MNLEPPKVEEWYVRPSDAGQPVDVSYGVDEDGYAWRRVRDRSSGTTTYEPLGEPWEPS